MPKRVRPAAGIERGSDAEDLIRGVLPCIPRVGERAEDAGRDVWVEPVILPPGERKIGSRGRGRGHRTLPGLVPPPPRVARGRAPGGQSGAVAPGGPVRAPPGEGGGPTRAPTGPA